MAKTVTVGDFHYSKRAAKYCRSRGHVIQCSRSGIDCKTVVFFHFRKARSAVSVILACEAREPHTPVGRLSPFSLAVSTLAPDLSFEYLPRRLRSQKKRLSCSLGQALPERISGCFADNPFRQRLGNFANVKKSISQRTKCFIHIVLPAMTEKISDGRRVQSFLFTE